MIATILEVTGFVLAILQTHNRAFSEQADRLVQSLLDNLGLSEMDYALPGADADKSLPEAKRKIIANRNFIFTLLCCVVLYWHYDNIEFGGGILLGTFELAVWLASGILLTIFLHIIAMFIFTLSISLVIKELIGNGDLITGIGLLLGICGLAVHSTELIEQGSWLTIIFVWTVLVGLIVYLRSKKKRNAPPSL